MKELNHPNTLLIGIGNSGRSDDGLGWAFVETIENKGGFLGKPLLRYQLQVEDAELLSEFEQVIFVDAFQGKMDDGFVFKRCLPAKDFSFTTHRLPPETVLYLCQELYGKKLNAFMLLINGEKWELDIGLSDFAGNNLEKALAFFDEKVNRSADIPV